MVLAHNGMSVNLPPKPIYQVYEIESKREHLLETFTSLDLVLEMALLVVQILELQMQPVDLLARLRRDALRIPGAEASCAVQAAQAGEVCGQQLLLPRDLRLRIHAEGCIAGAGLGSRDELDEGKRLASRRMRRQEDRPKLWVGNLRVDGHGVCALLRTRPSTAVGVIEEIQLAPFNAAGIPMTELSQCFLDVLSIVMFECLLLSAISLFFSVRISEMRLAPLLIGDDWAPL